MITSNPPTAVIPLNKKVLLALPFYKSTNPMTALCLMRLCDSRRASVLLNFGDAFISHSRNTCADHFLASTHEWMLMVDDDMILPFSDARVYKNYTGFDWVPDEFAAMNAIDRLLSHNKTLVGGLYFGRWPGAPPVYNEGGSPKEAEYARKAPFNEIKATRWVGTGALLINRQVFLDIEKKFPVLARGQNGMGGHWFSPSEHALLDSVTRIKDMLTDGPMTADKCYKALSLSEAALADTRANSSLGMGEDVVFSIRARQSGHIPYVDMGCLCGHVGQKVYGPKDGK